MQTEDDGAGERPARGLRAPLVLEHPPARVEAHAHAGAALHLEAVVALGLDARVGVARHEHAGREIAARVAGEVDGDRERLEVHGVASVDARAEGRVGDDHGLHVVLEAPRVLGGQRPLLHAHGEGERPAARDDVGDDRDRVARHPLEEEDRVAPAALVLEDDRHHVVDERDGLGDPDDLARVFAFVRGDEAPEILAHARSSRLTALG